MDQESQGFFSIRKSPNQLPGLLSNPELIRVGGDACKMNLTRTQFDEEEHIESLQQDGFHSEEVAGQDLIFVVCHQMAPTNGAITNRSGLDAIPDEAGEALAVENIANGWLRNLETQLDECTSDFAVTPTGVLKGKAENQFLKLFDGRWPSTFDFVGISPFPTI